MCKSYHILFINSTWPENDHLIKYAIIHCALRNSSITGGPDPVYQLFIQSYASDTLIHCSLWIPYTVLWYYHWVNFLNSNPKSISGKNFGLISVMVLSHGSCSTCRLVWFRHIRFLTSRFQTPPVIVVKEVVPGTKNRCKLRLAIRVSVKEILPSESYDWFFIPDNI